MTRPAKKERERYYLERFRSLYHDFPIGAVRPAAPPAPDFLVERPGSVLGIELTYFYWDTRPQRGSPGQEEYSRRAQVAYEAQRQWRAKGLPVVDVTVLFDTRDSLRNADKRVMAKQLLALAELHLPAPEEHASLGYPAGPWVDFPVGVRALWIHRTAVLERSFWSHSEGGAIPRLSQVTTEISERLQRKENRVPDYRSHCSEVWLLIVADGLHAAANLIVDDIEDSAFRSSFDRLFFLGGMSRAVVELRLAC